MICSPKKHLHNLNRLEGEWVFKPHELKVVDNLNNNVKIEKVKIEANSLTEKNKEASLPYGLKKQAKPKRKRATKKKTIEE